MKTRRNKLTTLLLTGILAIGMLAGTGNVAKAASNGDAGAQTAGSATGSDSDVNKGNATTQTSALGYITKNLFMDANVETPTNYKFNFTATAVTVDGVTANNSKGTPGYMPAIAISDIDTNTATPVATQYTTDESSYLSTPITSGKKVVTYKTDEFLNAFILDADHAGEYIYTVKESSFNESGTNKTADTEAMDKSEAVYTVHIYVANKYSNPTATSDWEYFSPNGLYIAGVGVYQTTDNAGNTPGTAPKVDANDTKGVGGYGSAFAFRNNYTPVASLRIEKQVQGAYADLTKKFNFETTITLPAIHNTVTSFDATVYKWDNTTSTFKVDTSQGASGVITFDDTTTPKYTATYTLSDQMYLQFNENLPVGTTYVTTETPVTDYTLSATVREANGGNALVIPATAVVNTTTGAIASKTIGDTTKLVTTDKPTGNWELATNTYKAVTPTGILINNLPFILMILVAVGGAVAYIMIKRRKVHRS